MKQFRLRQLIDLVDAMDEFIARSPESEERELLRIEHNLLREIVIEIESGKKESEMEELTHERVAQIQGGLHDVIRNSAEFVHRAVELLHMLIKGSLDPQLMTEYQEICYGFELLGAMKIVDK